MDILDRLLARTDTQISATSQLRDLARPQNCLRDAVARYLDAVQQAPGGSDAKPAHPAPLPWLPPVPNARDTSWTRYLTARAEQITALVNDIPHHEIGASHIDDRMDEWDPTLRRDWALWRVTHLNDDDSSLSKQEMLYLRHLEIRRTAAFRRETPKDAQRWMPLVAAISPNAVGAREYRQLATALTLGFNAGLDLDHLLLSLLHREDGGSAALGLTRMAGERGPRWPSDQQRPTRLDLDPLSNTIHIGPDL